MDNVNLLKSVYDAFGRGDIPTVLGAMSPDIHWHQAESNPYMPSGEAWVGPDAVLNNLFMRLGEEWDGFSVHPRSFHDAGGSVIVEARYSGRYKTTGKNMDTQVCHVWDIKDGKVTRFQQYADTAKLQRRHESEIRSGIEDRVDMTVFRGITFLKMPPLVPAEDSESLSDSLCGRPQ